MRHNKRLTVPLLIVVFVCLLAALVTHNSTKNDVASVTLPKIQSEKSSVLGASTSGYSIKVAQIIVGKTDDTTATKRITASVVITNSTDSEFPFSPGLQLFLIDARGTTYPITAKYQDPNRVLGGPIAKNSSASLDVDFEIPGNADPAQISFQPTASIKPMNVSLH